MPSGDIQVRSLAPEDLDAELDALTDLLRLCVEDGASVGFILPFAQSDAALFWREQVRPALVGGGRTLLAAFAGARLVGAVQLDCAPMANQPHRAEVMKLLVRPDARRRGVARALMAALEAEAGDRGRWLLTLDTASPDKAEPLYAALGYRRAGAIPEYALDPIEDRYDATVFMWKRL